MVEVTVHVVWDEDGNVAAAVEAEDAADNLDASSSGRFRRALALKLKLPTAEPMKLEVGLPNDAGATATLME